MIVDEQGFLATEPGDVQPLLTILSPKHYALEGEHPLGVVWHWTGWLGMDAEHYCRAAAQSARQASWHVMICRDGRVIQQVPFTRGSWHTGDGGQVGGRVFRNVNKATVGIELENAGRLKKIHGQWRYFVGGDNPWRGDIPEEQVRSVPGEGVFHNFTEAQVDAAAVVLGALVDAYGWDRIDCRHGHVDFAAPGKREDPGALWGCRRWPGTYLPIVLDEVFGVGGVCP